MNFVESGARLLYWTFQKTEYCSLSVYDNISGFVRWFSAARLQSHWEEDLILTFYVLFRDTVSHVERYLCYYE